MEKNIRFFSYSSLSLFSTHRLKRLLNIINIHIPSTCILKEISNRNTKYIELGQPTGAINLIQMQPVTSTPNNLYVYRIMQTLPFESTSKKHCMKDENGEKTEETNNRCLYDLSIMWAYMYIYGKCVATTQRCVNKNHFTFLSFFFSRKKLFNLTILTRWLR